ncbi:MAG: PKD domain-containing protein [Bacteroidetes bacterium]|nr:PKD domain-containing protein [Bacteroidota bacterium]
MSLIVCLPVFAQLRADFTPDKTGGCSPLIIHFTNRSTGSASATYLWDFGNGNTATVSDPQAVYTDLGDYPVTLTVSDGGASATVTHMVSVYAKPVFNFTYGPGSVCGPQPVTFTGSGASIVSWLWDFGDGTTLQTSSPTAQHVYPQSVSLPVSLTATNSFGCTDTVKMPVQVTVLTPATSSFQADKRVLCLVTDPVQFTNNSTGPGPLAFEWDFGDGTTSTQPNPGHSYGQKGTYTITLKTTASNGCTATSSMSNFLNVANYNTDFDGPTGAFCQSTSVTFTDKSTPSPNATQWLVDGNPTYYYGYYQTAFNTPGTHTVQLMNTYGNCPQTATKTVTVNPLPSIPPFDMVNTQACDHFTVAFTDHTPTATSWSWNFGTQNDEVSPGPAISHDFPYNLLQSVRLKVTDANGCSSSLSQTVGINKPTYSIYEINPGPAANSCVNPLTKTYAFQNIAGLQSWVWDFGDGTTSTDPQPTHTFSAPGAYGTVLRWTDLNGCTGTTNMLSTVIGGAMSVDFSSDVTTVCAGTPVNFTGPAITGNGATAGGVFVNWNFGDGVTAGNTNPSHSYYSPGVYAVTVNVANAGGCTGSITKTNYITVKAAISTFSGHAYTCTDRDVVTFNYTAAAGTSLTWQFGDGSSGASDASATQITHKYPATGTYNVDITAADGTCTRQFSDRVFLLKKQTLQISAASTVCVGSSLDVTMKAERNPASQFYGGIYDYTPQFYYGDGTPFGGSVTLTGSPNVNGTFQWTLSGFTPGKTGLKLVTSSYYFNCTDESNTIPLTIKGASNAAYTVVTDDRCYQSPVVLQDNTTAGANNSIVSETWDFGDGTSSNQIGGTITHTYASPGSYAVRLTASDAGGCTTTSAVNYVSVNGPKASFTPYPGTDVNLNTTMFFSNTSANYGSNGTVWSWAFGDGNTSLDYSPSYTFTVPGKYEVVLRASNPSQTNTCVTEQRTVINVRNFNSHFSTTESYVGTSKCPPLLAQFTNTSTGYMSVSWDFGDGWTAGNVYAPSHVYQQPGRYIVTLNVQGYNGLTASYIDSIFVREPVADLQSKTPLVCDGQVAIYEANATGAKNYTFDFGDGSVGSASYPDSVISHTYKVGDYTARLVVTDTFGCPAAANTAVKLSVHPNPVVSISPSPAYLCKDADLTLVATGGSTYAWSPAYGLNQTTGGTVIAKPSTDTKYQVLVTDAIGCHSTGDVTVHVVLPQKLVVTPDSTSVCYGDTVTLMAKGTDVYSWLGDVQGGSSPGTVIARPSASIVYTVIGQDIHSCFGDTAHVTVTVLPVPSVDGGPDVEVIAGSPVVLQATGSADVIRWEWTPKDYLSCTDCAQPVASPRKPENYVVKVFNEVGCNAKDTVIARILCEESRVRIPDAFSPNGDGRNDRFTILGIGQVKHIMIFNRWGVKVFERHDFFPADAESCWDGTINGQPAATGTYAYYVEMECPSGGIFGRRGTVVLVR